LPHLPGKKLLTRLFQPLTRKEKGREDHFAEGMKLADPWGDVSAGKTVMDAIYPVLSGALAQEKRLELITNNLANVGTNGYKKDVPVFEALTPENAQLTTAETGDLSSVPAYGHFSRTSIDLSPGVVRTTGQPLDIAIEGEGLFAVQTPQGIRYTRNGHFSLDVDGQLVTTGGFPVLGGGGPITIPAGTVAIGSDGRISVSGGEAGPTAIEIDQIPVFIFPRADQLQKTGGSLFSAPAGAAVPTTDTLVRQGALEGSNVNPVEEMVAMIEVMRLYEAAQKAIQTADQIAGKVSNEIGQQP